MIVAVGNEAEVLAPLSADRSAQHRALDSIDPWGTTSLHDAIIATIVVQFGTATIRGDPSNASGFTSGITSGTSGSMRNPDDLSMQTVPSAAAGRRNSRATDAPAADSNNEQTFREKASLRAA